MTDELKAIVERADKAGEAIQAARARINRARRMVEAAQLLWEDRFIGDDEAEHIVEQIMK